MDEKIILKIKKIGDCVNIRLIHMRGIIVDLINLLKNLLLNFMAYDDVHSYIIGDIMKIK